MNALLAAVDFASSVDAQFPLFMSPMTGASPVSLAAAISNSGGMGACGTSLIAPDAITAWAREFRTLSSGALNINIWIPGPSVIRDVDLETKQRQFLSTWGPEVPSSAVDIPKQDFEGKCQAALEAKPTVISSFLGVFPSTFVSAMKAQGIKWFATVTTVAEAVTAQAAGADVLVVQGSEAGGHRGSFRAENAEAEAVGLFSLLPQVCDAARIPVVAAGGISDGRTIAAALILGASAVQIGTGWLRTPEAKIHPAWAKKIAEAAAHDTRLTRAFSGRSGRAIRNDFLEAAAEDGAPKAAAFPIQLALAFRMIGDAVAKSDPERFPLWAGQSAPLARELPVNDLLQEYWREVLNYLG
ncbi:NAD(P)H-dependent flavin oxidoreductase [Granulicella paludicola]|uniref:NAD(P)H-dependent flavin oxidoreductase n=1 Tax=Granulicella paludicola TaxID=474951 RepID=UPI0021E0EF90|nr:nitronate monooxygenase [Granulicella paludicola]